MEIGSFIEMQFPKGREWYNGGNVLRLNSGRAGIYHAFRLTGCTTLWMPYYQCDSVRKFLEARNVRLKFYHISDQLEPDDDLIPTIGDAVLLVNYFGIMTSTKLSEISSKYNNPVIVDNSQAFFCEPIVGAYNVYSCRKFIGVPDGAYVVGADVKRLSNNYKRSFSSKVMGFLLERIEYGCCPSVYSQKIKNDKRIEADGVKLMSKITHTILDGTDYEYIINKRKENYAITQSLFGSKNKLQLNVGDVVPMVYPLLVEDDSLVDRLQKAGHFQGHWWEYLVDEMDKDNVEYYLSRYLVPITIDQRYGRKELEYIASKI